MVSSFGSLGKQWGCLRIIPGTRTMQTNTNVGPGSTRDQKRYAWKYLTITSKITDYQKDLKRFNYGR
jgi:hypothetical protein